MANTVYVNLNIMDTIQKIEAAVIKGSFTGEEIDHYEVRQGSNRCVVLVFEKHYYRAGNRLTLTVVIDDMAGRTRVHTIGGGGGEGLFRFDWGASDSFENVAVDALEGFIIG